MRSRASYKGHPIHPALIPFPFAFLWGAFLFDVAGYAFERPGWWTTGGYLGAAGVVTALVAAVPGLIDYRFTVPPNSTGKQRATRHMLVMSGAVLLFGAAWWLRTAPAARPVPLQLFLELGAVGLLTAGAWMGGVLVNRNQIGVDPRYAGAGKWSERRVDGTSSEGALVAMEDDLQPDQMRLIRAGSRRIVLARTESGYVAFDDRCTHRGGSLAGGAMICGTVQCPWHGSQFDVVTGAVKAGPAAEPIRCYEVVHRNGEVRLVLP